MPKFRKKPVVIEAVQLTWENRNEVCDFAGVGKISDGKPEGCYIDRDGSVHDKPPGGPDTIGLSIPTPEGVMVARQGDWIIKGVKGELDSCKSDIFEATYEPAASESVDIGIRVQEEPPEQSNGIRFMTIVRIDRNMFQAARPKDARLMVRRQFQFALPPLMKVVDEEHVKLNPPEGSAGGVDFGREGGELPDGPAVPGG